MNKGIMNEWLKTSSFGEKIIAFIVGSELGDFISNTLYTFFSIDSFILTTIIGVSSILLICVLFQLVRDGYIK